MNTIAVIDLGSNSLKLFVFKTTPSLRIRHRSTRETRLGTGMGSTQPTAIPAATLRAVSKAAGELAEEARTFSPDCLKIIATSAAREASNQEALCQSIEAATGTRPEIISGLEEARLIGLGVSTDPTLADIQGSFTLLDIGGGSAELIDFKHNNVKQITSLPLGSVRLTDRFVKNPAEAMDDTTADLIAQETEKALLTDGFNLEETSRPLVGTGGAFTICRMIFAARKGLQLFDSEAHLSCEDMAHLLVEIARMPMAERLKIPGLPEARADILPAALITVLTMAQKANARAFIHSFHNLPFGVAANLLNPPATERADEEADEAAS